MSTDISLSVTPTGDLDTISGDQNLKKALERRLLTVRGSWAFRPDYGVGIQRYIGSMNSIATHRKIANEIAEQFPRDPRVQKVVSVKISQDPANTQLNYIHVEVIQVGGSNHRFTFTVGDMP